MYLIFYVLPLKALNHTFIDRLPAAPTDDAEFLRMEQSENWQRCDVNHKNYSLSDVLTKLLMEIVRDKNTSHWHRLSADIILKNCELVVGVITPCRIVINHQKCFVKINVHRGTHGAYMIAQNASMHTYASSLKFHKQISLCFEKGTNAKSIHMLLLHRQMLPKFKKCCEN